MLKDNGEQIGQSINDFIYEWGVPEHLTFDRAMAQRGRNTPFMKAIQKHNIDWHVSQPRTPKENPAEGSIREVKRRYYRMKEKYGMHDRLWDFLTTYICETGNVTANSSKYAKGRTPMESISGDTPDISEYMDFSFYDLVTYKSNPGVHSPEIGRWLGVLHRVGPEMAYWILPESGRPISCTTVQRITDLKIGEDNFVGMEVGIRRGDDARLDKGIVKKRAVGED